MVITYGGGRSWQRRSGRGRRPRRTAVAIPLCALVAALVLMAVFGRRLLLQAVLEPVNEASAVPFFLASAAFLVSAAALVVVQALRTAERAAGPERRLIQAIRRVRTGDVGFRVHLRSGELLVNLADEFNALLDWLNVNPPQGVITGSDVVEVEAMELEPPPELEVTRSLDAEPAESEVEAEGQSPSRRQAVEP